MPPPVKPYSKEKIQSFIDKHSGGKSPLNANFFIGLSNETGVPVELMLAQGLHESHFGTRGRAARTKNMFNVGNTTPGDVLRAGSPEQEKYNRNMSDWEAGARSYANLIKNSYLKEKDVDSLLTNFVNTKGNRYATAPNYESVLRKTISGLDIYDGNQQQLKETNMADPTKTGGAFAKEGRGKVYATSGDMATDILGKNIGQVSANELMTMAMNQGYSRKDAKRATKGLEKFQQLGGQAEMVFDPGANRYNIIFKNEDGVEVNPRQGRRLGGNAAFGASDLLGLGRDVNTLASVISRQRGINAEKTVAPTTTELGISRISEPSLNMTMPLQLRQRTNVQPEVAEPETEQVNEETSISQIPPLDVLDKKYPLPNTLQPEIIAKKKKESTEPVDEFFKKKSYDYFSQYAPGVSYREPIFNESRYSKYITGYRKALKLNPSLTKEEYYQQTEKELAKQGVSDAFDAASWIGGTKALQATNWLAKQGLKKAAPYVVPRVKKGLQWIKNLRTTAPKSSPTPSIKIVTQPNLPLANELPPININRNALSKLTAEAKKKFDDAVSWVGNSFSWRKGLSPERQAEIIAYMKQYGILKNGGKLSAASLMGLPKAQGGLKLFTDDDLNPALGKVELDGDNSRGSFLWLDPTTVTAKESIPDYNSIKDGPKEIVNDEVFKKTERKNKRGIYGKGSNRVPGKNFDWKNAMETGVIVGAPLLASLQKQPKTTIPLPQKLQFRAPVAADMPRPQVMNVSPNLQDMGTDVQTRMMYGNVAEAQNKQIANQWNVQNALQKREAQRAGMDVLNRQDMINAQMLGDVQMRQSYLDAQRRQGDFANKIGSQQSAYGNIVDRMRWNAADKAQSQTDWAAEVIKNPERYGGTESNAYKKAMQTMSTGLGLTEQGRYGMKLKASNLLKKK